MERIELQLQILNKQFTNNPTLQGMLDERIQKKIRKQLILSQFWIRKLYRRMGPYSKFTRVEYEIHFRYNHYNAYQLRPIYDGWPTRIAKDIHFAVSSSQWRRLYKQWPKIKKFGKMKRHGKCNYIFHWSTSKNCFGPLPFEEKGDPSCPHWDNIKNFIKTYWKEDPKVEIRY